MKQILLLSGFASNKDTYLNLIFPNQISEKRLAYLPVNGSQCPLKYQQEWQEYAQQYGANFEFINDIKKDSRGEDQRLLSCNILVISGGNTFELLHNLRQSGLDQAIKQFAQQEEFVLAGFSAGAIVLTPSIKICRQPGFDPNLIGLSDLTGLGLVNFEIWPHYQDHQQSLLESYRQQTQYEVEIIKDGEWRIINNY